MNSTEFDNISFDMPKTQSNSIKVIGVGGGGSNAVNHMFQQNIKGVDFVICNTDAQALENSPIPNKIQLGASLTSGLGAGANPDVGEEAAKESLEEIKTMLSAQTKMVFITAGMGGGTGTGAAPIIAEIAKDMDVLTVGIVTMPFQFEGRMRAKQAQKGIDLLREKVDSLIVVNNNKLREVYGNLGFKAGFSKADEVLSTASRGIAEVITHHYKQNIDLHDAKTVLSNSGTAIMGSAKESGTNRAKNAISKALDSPLLNDNKITGAKNVLLLIVSGSNEVTLDEIGEINDFIQTEAGYDANIIMGIGEDESLEDAIAVTVVATGFAADQQCDITNTEVKRIVHTLEDEQKATYNFSETNSFEPAQQKVVRHTLEEEVPKKIVHQLEDEPEQVEEKLNLIPTTDLIKNIDVVYEEVLSEATNFEEDFIITPAAPVKQKAEEKTVQSQMDLLFDLPIEESKQEEPQKKIYFDLTDEIKEIEINDPIEVVAETKNPSEDKKLYFDLTDEIKEIEVNDPIEVVAEKKIEEEPVKRYSLEDFMDVEPTIKNASTRTVEEKVVAEDEVGFVVRTEAKKIEEIEVKEVKEVSPLNLTISELQQRAEDRREKMKGFNYKFRNNVNQSVDEIEKQPAYKRMGVDLEQSSSSDVTQSRVTLSIDDNDEIQLRSNNSFLHDNVD